MWIVAKIKSKEIEIFKSQFQKKIQGIKIYFPKIKNNLKKSKNLLGNYVFCYHSTFNENFKTYFFNNLKGLDYLLSGNLKDQNQIKNFIEHCHKNEDSEGYISNSFFKIDLKNKGKIVSGPLANYLFELAHKEKNKINVNVGKFKVSISDYSMSLYQSI